MKSGSQESKDLKVFIAHRESTCDEYGEQQFPRCPKGREREIAEHACLKFSGRVGRSAAAKALDQQAVRLAVIANVRHRETDYDKLLARRYDRSEARAAVQEAVGQVLQRWETQS